MVLAIIGALFAASQAISGGVSSWMFSELAQSEDYRKFTGCDMSSLCKDVSCITFS